MDCDSAAMQNRHIDHALFVPLDSNKDALDPNAKKAGVDLVWEVRGSEFLEQACEGIFCSLDGRKGEERRYRLQSASAATAITSNEQPCS